MATLADKRVLVMDFGNYIDVAERLSRDYGAVFYFNPVVVNGYPTHTPMDIGSGVNGVIKVKEWASVINEVDLVVFPDSMEPALQDFFRNTLGKAVFGCCYADRLEHDRKYLKEVIKSSGLPYNNYVVAEGLDELDEFLQGTKDRYIKSCLRGDCETWHHTDYRLSKGEIKRMRHEMGLYENRETYIIEEPIESIAEIGYDGFSVYGMYPHASLCGIEIKDAFYCGRFINYISLPEQIRKVNEAMSPYFRDMGFCGHYSNEVMITKDKRGILVDNTCRTPQPPGSLALEIYSNYSHMVWEIANGIVPNIEHEYNWGVQLIIKSDMATTEPSPILIPEDVRRFVKIKNLSVNDEGTFFYVPNNIEMKEIGSVIGMGNTLDEAFKNAKQVSESIEGFDISIKTDGIDKAKKQMEKLSKAGISFI